MKLILAWFCLFSKAAAFPTAIPPKTEGEKPLVGPPKLLFRGYDTKHGINVFLFEFPPLKKESKAKMNSENQENATTLRSEGSGEAPPNTDNDKQPEHVATETNTPAYPPDSDVNSDTIVAFANGTSDNNQNTDLKPLGISSNIIPNKIQKHETFDFDTNSGLGAHEENEQDKEHGAIKKSNLTLMGDIENTHYRKTQKPNEQSSVAGSFSAYRVFNDIPGYNNSQKAKRDSNLQLSSKEKGELECMKTNGSCKNATKHNKDPEVNTSTYEKEDFVYQRNIDLNSDIVSNFTNDSSVKGDNQRTNTILSGTSMNATRSNISKHNTSSGPKSVTQYTYYGEHGGVQSPYIALGDQAKHTNDKEEPKAIEENDTDGYYSTGGITLTDIPGYSESKVAKQDPNLQYPSKDIDTPRCTKTDGLCENDQVSNKSTHNNVNLDTKEQVNVVKTIKDPTIKKDGRQDKTVKLETSKSKQQAGKPNVNKKHASTKFSITRNTKKVKEQRVQYNSRRYLNQRHHRHSSSESKSDSSQEFD